MGYPHPYFHLIPHFSRDTLFSLQKYWGIPRNLHENQPKAIKPSRIPDLHNMKPRMEPGREREALHVGIDRPNFEPVEGSFNIP